MPQVCDADGDECFSDQDWLPDRHGRERYATKGFKEISMFSGVTQRSYRKTAANINRVRHQEVGGTPSNTLRDQSVREGSNVLNFLEKKTQQVLQSHKVGGDGQLSEKSCLKKALEQYQPMEQPKRKLKTALNKVKKSMKHHKLNEKLTQQIKPTKLNKLYESEFDSINISVDDVGTKKQKETREKGVITEKQKNKRPTVQNTVAQIERPGQGFTLTGSNVAQVLRFVMAFLLNNGLTTQQLVFFTDGQRSIQGAITDFFSWHSHVKLILDWFHVVKKFKEGLSLACTGRGIRNKHLKTLLRMLWYGLIEQADEYLASISPNDLKNIEAINTLRGYLDRNKNYLPCYALRKELGLPNSSNPAERMNNIVTANRQKRNGMSWSENGSHALTALTTVTSNRATESWLNEGVVPFQFVDEQKNLHSAYQLTRSRI